MGCAVLWSSAAVTQASPDAASPVSTVLDGVLFVCDSADDRVLAFEDVNRSGCIEPQVDGEMRVFYDDSSPGPDLSTPTHLIADERGRIYLLDGGTLDQVLILSDNSGDGDANDEGEVRTFYSSEVGSVPLATPNTLVRGRDAAFYVVDDGSAARRIVRLEDLDHDGDANDEGEATIVYDSTALSPVLPEDLESLTFDAEGNAYAGESTLGAVFRLNDANDDGDVLDRGEVSVFYQSDEDQPLHDIDCLAAVDGSLLVCDEDSGLIVRLRDANQDGIVEGAGEVSVFLDDSAASRVRDTNDFTALATGGLLVLDGALDTVFLVRDLNGDDDALDDGEVSRWIADDGENLATPSGLAFVIKETEVRPVFVRGDASGDGRLDISDPIVILAFLFEEPAPGACADTLDADDDGAVNVADAVLLLNFLFSGGAPPPEPFPEPGVDPTTDSLKCDGEAA